VVKMPSVRLDRKCLECFHAPTVSLAAVEK
jgi:hypothetical protein